MKKITALAGIALIAGMTITGCSDTNTKQGTTQSTNQKVDKSTVSKFLNEYYTNTFKNASTAEENTQKIETTMKNILGEEDYNKVIQNPNAFASLDEISKDKQKKLADEIQKLNPMASSYDFSNMSDSDRIYMNLLSIASTSMMSGTQNGDDLKVEITIPEDKITVKENKATVNFADMTIKINDQESDQKSDPMGQTQISLVSNNGEWKIDGKSTFEALKEDYQEISEQGDNVGPSDGGGASDNGNG